MGGVSVAKMNERILYKVAGLPVQQNRVFPDRHEAECCRTGEIELVQNMATGLIYNRAFCPELLVYDENYQNEQALSQAFQDHLEQVAGIIERHFHDQRMVEIGCGKGWFLEFLERRGCSVTGIDPAYEGDNPNVVKAQFSSDLGVRADAWILRHVLEHISDPAAFLDTIRRADDGNGSIYIEVPSFEWISEHRAWFDVFYEHVNYFRLSDLQRMFAVVHDAGYLFGGQYLYIVADLSSLRTAVRPLDEEFSLPGDFLSPVDRAVEKFQGLDGRQTAVWGASSKGVIFTLYLARRGVRPDFVIDINPAKQRRFLPVTGLEISSPDMALSRMRPGDVVFVMNSNYLNEIRQQAGEQFEYIEVDQYAI